MRTHGRCLFFSSFLLTNSPPLPFLHPFPSPHRVSLISPITHQHTMAAGRDRVRMLVGDGTRPVKMKGLNHKGIWSRWANPKPNFKWAYLSNHLELSELFDGPGRSEHASLLDITYMLTSRIFRIFQAAKKYRFRKFWFRWLWTQLFAGHKNLRDGPTGMLTFHSIHLSVKLWQCTSELPIADSQRPWSRRRPRNRPSAGPVRRFAGSACMKGR